LVYNMLQKPCLDCTIEPKCNGRFVSFRCHTCYFHGNGRRIGKHREVWVLVQIVMRGMLFLLLLIGISSCLQVSQADSVLWKCLADQAPTTVCVFKPRIEDRESTLLALSTSRKKISKNIADSCVTTIARFLSPDSVSLIMM
jgi:hypothetical protein